MIPELGHQIVPSVPFSENLSREPRAPDSDPHKSVPQSREGPGEGLSFFSGALMAPSA